MQFGLQMARVYQEQMVPMVFEPFAREMAVRAVATAPRELLEVAAGTGAVTSHLAQLAPVPSRIIATDVSVAMLEIATERVPERVELQIANAEYLPYPDACFDAVVCQFGVMFFNDKVKALREFYRVLKPGGTLSFSVWCSTKENDFVGTVDQAVSALLSDHPARFFKAVPHGYHSAVAIERDIRNAGFTSPVRIDDVQAISIGSSAADVAKAYCQGTPLREELRLRGVDEEKALQAAEAALALRFGSTDLRGRLVARFVSVVR